MLQVDKKSLKTKIAATAIALSSAVVSQVAVAKTVLWGTSVSPYVRKVQIVLDEKQIAYEHKEILPKVLNDAIGEANPQEFLNISPLGKIPAIQDGKVNLADSSVISAYLEKKYQGTTSLYPKGAEEYARAIWFENYSEHVLGVATKHIFFEKFVKPNVLKTAPDNNVVNKAITQEMPEILDYLNTEIKKNKWLAGNEFSIADIAIATQFIALQQAGYKVDANKWPAVDKYLQKVFARESFKKNMIDSKS